MASFGGRVAVSALALALATKACPAAGQQVPVTFDFPFNPLLTPTPITGSLTTERNLREPVPPPIDLAALNRQEAQQYADGLNRAWRFRALVVGGPIIDTGCTLVPWEVVNGTTVRFNATIAAARPGRAECNYNIFPQGATGSGFYDHRVFSVEVSTLVDNRNGSPGEVRLTGLMVDGRAIAFAGPSLAVARQSLLVAARNASGYRYYAGGEVRTGGGPVIVTDRILNQRVTGRDTITAFTVTAASPQQPDPFITTGTRINCPTANSSVGCQGGVRIENVSVFQLTTLHVFNTLYITNTVERTLTGGTTFFDVPLTPLPSGAVHALAAQGALGGGQRFLERLGDHDALVDRRGMWGDIEGVRQRFAAAAPLGRGAVDAMAIRLGFDLAAAPGLTLGLAGEYAHDDLGIADAIMPESGTLDRWSVGAHARLVRGRFTGSIAATIGQVEAGTLGASALGNARASYRGTLYGAAARAGIALGNGPVQLVPEVGASWTGWRRDGFTEAGGPAPLTVRTSRDEQTRLWAGAQVRWTGGDNGRGLTLSAYGRAIAVGGDRLPAVDVIDPQLPDRVWRVTAPGLGATIAAFGARADLNVGSGGRLSIGYTGQADGGFDDQTARLSLRLPL